MTGYILCTSPRSGSTLLCAMLKAVGAGDPRSLFYESEPAGWAERLGITADPETEEGLRMIFAAGVEAGRNGTPVFALRQQRRSFPALQAALIRAYTWAESDLARLTAAFGPVRFLYLKRQDKIGQAVSLLRAEATGLWHQAADGTEIERDSPRRADGFDAGAIARTMRLFHSYEAGWQDWFATNGIAPHTLTYEALSADPAGALAAVLDHLDLDPELARGMAPPLAKLADKTTEAWIARFLDHPASQTV